MKIKRVPKVRAPEDNISVYPNRIRNLRWEGAGKCLSKGSESFYLKTPDFSASNGMTNTSENCGDNCGEWIASRSYMRHHDGSSGCRCHLCANSQTMDCIRAHMLCLWMGSKSLRVSSCHVHPDSRQPNKGTCHTLPLKIKISHRTYFWCLVSIYRQFENVAKYVT